MAIQRGDLILASDVETTVYASETHNNTFRNDNIFEAHTWNREYIVPLPPGHSIYTKFYVGNSNSGCTSGLYVRNIGDESWTLLQDLEQEDTTWEITISNVASARDFKELRVKYRVQQPGGSLSSRKRNLTQTSSYLGGVGGIAVAGEKIRTLNPDLRAFTTVPLVVTAALMQRGRVSYDEE
jgi:hypothetical protein